MLRESPQSPTWSFRLTIPVAVSSREQWALPSMGGTHDDSRFLTNKGSYTRIEVIWERSFYDLGLVTTIPTIHRGPAALLDAGRVRDRRVLEKVWGRDRILVWTDIYSLRVR